MPAEVDIEFDIESGVSGCEVEGCDIGEAVIAVPRSLSLRGKIIDREFAFDADVPPAVVIPAFIEEHLQFIFHTRVKPGHLEGKTARSRSPADVLHDEFKVVGGCLVGPGVGWPAGPVVDRVDSGDRDIGGRAFIGLEENAVDGAVTVSKNINGNHDPRWIEFQVIGPGELTNLANVYYGFCCRRQGH